MPVSYTARRQALSPEVLTHPPPFFFRALLLLTPLGGDVIFLTPVGVGEKTNTPARSRHPLKRTKQGLESNSRAPVEYSYPKHISGCYRSNEKPTGAIDDQGMRWHTPTAPHPPHTGAGGNDSSPKPDSKAKPNAPCVEQPSPGTHTTCQQAPKPTTSHPSAGEDSTPSTTGKSSAEHATEAKATEHNQTFNSNNKPQKP